MRILFFAMAFYICSSLMSVFSQSESRFDNKSSYGATSSFAPTSSHILIGMAQGRQISTAGLEYTRRFFQNTFFQLDYAGEVEPFYRESDPTVAGWTYTYNGQVYSGTYPAPIRTTGTGPSFTCIPLTTTCVPLYNTPGPNEITYGFAIAPLGMRTIFMRRHRIQPTFLMNAGYVLTRKSIPVDNVGSVNYQLALGPGVQVFASKQNSIRLEYLFRHISNGGRENDPGIDQGVFRLTWSRHH